MKSKSAILARSSRIAQVQTGDYPFVVDQTNPEAQQVYADDVQMLFRTMLPFQRKWIKLPSDYQELYRQMVETQQPDFVAVNIFTTAWGIKSI